MKCMVASVSFDVLEATNVHLKPHKNSRRLKRHDVIYLNPRVAGIFGIK